MESLKVVKIIDDELIFDNGTKLYSDHDQYCCEHHYLNFSGLELDEFDDLVFDLSDDTFFRPIEGFGVELVPINGHSVRVAGYGYNNGYYGSNIDLVMVDAVGKELNRYDVSECQDLSEN